MRARAAALLAATALAVAMVPAQPAAAAPLPPVARVRVVATPVVGGLVKPVAAAALPDGRLLVVEKRGTVRVVANGRLLPGNYLTLTPLVESKGWEQGLLGIAVDPQFATSPRLWLTFVARGTGDLVLATIRARSAAATHADGTTLRTVLTIRHRATITHYGGSLVFDNDGMLLLSTGDGGCCGDPSDNARNGRSLLGKILRLDARRACLPLRYCVPTSNPRYAQHRKDLSPVVWAMGMRNPWRTSIDPLTGDLWLGDVGQDRYEEVDRIPAGAGGIDLGWPCREGRHSYNPARCAGRTMSPPVWTGCHEDKLPTCPASLDGDAVIGGIVYRGTAQPAISGAYVFADFISGAVRLYRARSSALVGSVPGLVWIGRGPTGEPLGLTLGGQLLAFRARVV
jgi:glucose/arabinose dehydrogenase